MKGRHFILLAAAVLVASAPPALAGPTVKGDYVAGTGDFIIICEIQQLGVEPCIGGYTFSVPSTASGAAITIDDAVTDSTAGYYQFTDSNGNPTGDDDEDEAAFCDPTSVTVPSSADDLHVFVDTGFSAVDCNPNEQPAFGTSGTIEVTWS